MPMDSENSNIVVKERAPVQQDIESPISNPVPSATAKNDVPLSALVESKKSNLTTVNAKATALKFAGLDKSGIPTGWTVTDSSGSLGSLYFSNREPLFLETELRLSQLARNIVDKRVDFFVRGEYGKDFTLYFKGKELDYKNRSLYYEGKKLSKYLQVKALETADAASSYLYILTFIHLLHIIVTLIYLIKMTINSFSGKYDNGDVLSLRLGAIFWHFLGILWGYLLLFLLFIH
jgi:hypothetical protein